MRILFLDQFSDLGGAQLCIRDLLPEIKNRGWRAQLMAPGNGPLNEAFKEFGFPVRQLSLRNYASGRKNLRDILQFPLDTALIARAVRTEFRTDPFDLVYVNGPRVLLGATAAPCPLVFHAHSYVTEKYARNMMARSLRLKDSSMVAVSHFVAQPLEALAGAPAAVIYNGVADQGFTAREFLGPQIHVGIMGRIAPEKGQADFVRAAGLVAAKHPGVLASIFGAPLFSGSSYECHTRALAAGTPVQFRGWTHNVPQALREIDILAVPSGPAEAATRVIPEALSAGTPVVAYPSGGIPELIRHNETGLLTSASRYECLAESIEMLIANRALMRRLAANGRREWERRFRVERFQRDILDYLEMRAPNSGRTLHTSAARSVPGAGRSAHDRASGTP